MKKYKVEKVTKIADDGTGRTKIVWRVNAGCTVADFDSKWEAQDYADEMNKRDERTK